MLSKSSENEGMQLPYVIRRRVKIKRVLQDDSPLDQEMKRKHRQQKDFLQAVRSNDPGKIRDMLNQIRETQSSFPLKTLCNALYLAIEKGSFENAKLLAGPCSKHVDLSDVILVCARHGRVEIADFLFQNGYCKNVNYLMTKSAHEKNYPLMEALQNEQEEMVVWLLQNNANVHVVDLGSNSILHLSAAVGNGHGIAASILQGVNMKLQNNAQETAIELADSEDAIRIFLECAILRSNPDFQPSPMTGECILSYPKKRTINPGRNPFTINLDHSSCVGEFFWLCVALVGTDDELFDMDREEETRDRKKRNSPGHYHIYPSYRLYPIERLYFLSVVLGEIMQGPSDPPFETNILLESVFVVIFEVAAQYLSNQQDHILAQKLFDAFEETYDIKLSDLGIRHATHYWPRLYRPMIDLVCKAFFGELYWAKLELFRSNDAWRRDKRLDLPLEIFGPHYFVTKLPDMQKLSIDDLTCWLKDISRFAFRHIHLEIAIDDPGPGFANIFLHLQEASDYRKTSDYLELYPPSPKLNSEPCLESLQLRSKAELGKFWLSLSAKDKWSIVEMDMNELRDIINDGVHWELMRASVNSYIHFAWETDLLEIYEKAIIIIDGKMNDTRDIELLIVECLEAITIPCKRKNGKGKKYEIDLQMLRKVVGIESHYLREFPENTSWLPDVDAAAWEQKGRRMLENLVLCELTRKVALEYLRQREQSRMRAEALEMEIELLNESSDATNKTPTKKKKKRRKKKKKQAAVEKPSEPKTEEVEGATPSETRQQATEERAELPPQPTAPKDPTQVDSFEQKQHDLQAEKKADICSEYNHSNPFAMLTNSGKKKETKKENVPKAEKTKKKNRKKNKKKKKESREKKSAVADPVGASKPLVRTIPAEPKITTPIDYRKYKKGIVMPCKDKFSSVMEMQLIGLPKTYLRLVKALEPDTTALFLFNMAAKMLYGVYEPIMDTNGWCIQGSHGSYPTQLKFKCVEAFKPVPRKCFGHVFSHHERPQSLTQVQVMDLVDVFRNPDKVVASKKRKTAPKPQTSTAPKPPTANMNKRMRKKPTQQPVQSTSPRGIHRQNGIKPNSRHSMVPSPRPTQPLPLSLDSALTFVPSITPPLVKYEEFLPSERSSQSKSPQTPVSSSYSGPVISDFGLDDTTSGVSSSVGRASHDSDLPAEDVICSRERTPQNKSPLLPEEPFFCGIEAVLNDASNFHSSAKLPDNALDTIYSFADSGDKPSPPANPGWPAAKKQRTNRPGTRTFSDDLCSQSMYDFEKLSYSPPKRFKATDDKTEDDEPYLIMSGLTAKSVSAPIEGSSQFNYERPSERRKGSSESDRSVEPLHLFGLHNSWDVWGNNPGGKGWSSVNATKEPKSSKPNKATLNSKFDGWDDNKIGASLTCLTKF